MRNRAELEVFAEVFSTGYAGCTIECHCGKVFYDSVNSYDWNEGELESLLADKTAVALSYSVRGVVFEGKEYVSDCDCWKDRASKIIVWLDANAERVGSLFRELKQVRIAEADKLPIDIKFPFPDGFRSMVGAPKNATWIEVLTEDGHIQKAHWAQDESGEYQPAFRGWFAKNGECGFYQIDEPIAWKPILIK